MRTLVEVFISGNVPSSKNSKVWTGKKLISSRLARNYVKEKAAAYTLNRVQFTRAAKLVKPPYHIEFEFIRDSWRKFDYINAAQIVQDMMVKHRWIEDDNCHIMIPSFRPYSVDKANAGVWIRLIQK